MIRLPRPVYIAWRVLEGLFLIGSQTLNATTGGSTRERFSARCHIEQLPARHIVNAIFFWQDDHCRLAVERQVKDARWMLDRAQNILDRSERALRR